MIVVASVIYAFIALVALMMVFNHEVYDTSKKKGDLKAFKKRWYQYPLFLFTLSLAVLALGSGFWFTGSAWIIGTISVRAFSEKIRNDKTLEFDV